MKITIEEKVNSKGEPFIDWELENEDGTESRLFLSPLNVAISILAEFDLLPNKDVDTFVIRLHEEHREVLEVNMLNKIKEGLQLAEDVEGAYYI
jgi:hypothetical protein